MKKEQCRIELLPQGREVFAAEGDSLYTLLLVEGVISPDSSNKDRVRLEKGAISPPENPEAEAAVFSKPELTEGWMLASERRIAGDAVIMIADQQTVMQREPLGSGYGMAVDAGTATLAAGLVNMDGLNIPYFAATRNSQSKFGVDVNARLAWLRNNPDDKDLLAQSMREDIDLLAHRLAEKAGIDAKQIKVITIAGNHLITGFLLGDKPREMHRFAEFSAEEIGFTAVDAAAQCYFLPDSSVDIGSDTVSAALSGELSAKKDKDRFTLLIDLGMSSQVILAGRGRLLAASVDTLPFEGADISCGTYAVTGAITRVLIDDDVVLLTVRDGKPVGLCGAGLISTIHAFLESGMIDHEGRLAAADDFPERLAARFKNTMSGRRFILSAGANEDEDIFIDQDDIRQFQFSKGSVYAACQAVMHEAGAQCSDIDQILLAESYGAHIRPASALAVGLLPAIGVEHIHSIGNAAWQGAYLVLGNKQCLVDAEQLSANIERLDLAANMVFAEQFITAMNF